MGFKLGQYLMLLDYTRRLVLEGDGISGSGGHTLRTERDIPLLGKIKTLFEGL